MRSPPSGERHLLPAPARQRDLRGALARLRERESRARGRRRARRGRSPRCSATRTGARAKSARRKPTPRRSRRRRATRTRRARRRRLGRSESPGCPPGSGTAPRRGSPAGTTADTSRAAGRRSARPSPARRARRVPRSSRWTGPIFVITPISGCAVSQSSAIWPSRACPSRARRPRCRARAGRA